MSRTRLIGIALALAVGAGARLLEPGGEEGPHRKADPGHRPPEGFRYYLNRPYLVVKDPVLIFERLTMVEVTGDRGGIEVAKFLDGQRKGQTVNLAELNLKKDSPAFRPVGPRNLAGSVMSWQRK